MGDSCKLKVSMWGPGEEAYDWALTVSSTIKTSGILEVVEIQFKNLKKQKQKKPKEQEEERRMGNSGGWVSYNMDLRNI